MAILTLEDRIETKEEYEATRKRLEKADAVLEGQWDSDDPKVKKWIKAYGILTEIMLIYETENDLLPI